MNFLQHIKAVYAALSLVGVVGAEVAVKRAAWHLHKATNMVAWGWSNELVNDNYLRFLFLQGARKRVHTAVQSGSEVVKTDFSAGVVAWLNSKEGHRAPECPGMPESTNVWCN